MIPGPALRGWLADRSAQDESHRRVEACARRWSGHPLMTDIDRALAALPARTPEAVLAAARRFLDRGDDLSALVRDLIASSRADGFFRPPFQPATSEIHTGLLLFHNDDLSLAMGVTGVEMLAAKKAGPRGATSIGFSGLVTLFRYVKAGGATLSFWEAPRIGENFVASEAGTARLVGRRRIEDGEEIVIDGRRQSFVIEHATSDMVYFQALVRTGAAPLAAEYDSRTLALIGTSSTDEASSRIQLMVSLLRTMERQDAFPLFEELLGAMPQFYTRWHIMREMLAMDANAALPALRRLAARDPHPEVRAAAGQTLDLFFPEATADQEGLLCRA
ncbi:HEAT repeat domain-containing protein [Sphingosinicella sp. LHD-64]|uniref:HEAT repeat domain-containing protein n=1 Tax=Sphingosinicella sp. LHD-64 TaxID=3072139 RepID=UPI00280E6829|nr:HEAT repeat domain-containing protein [Sphingosinicella sp. LHD-64]MDQ8755368.1 HEAT repeat domain-containing protein [Sphingosinicella sp. LHD-64]